MTECFVCLGSDGLLLRNICACKSSAIHQECQRKLVKSKKDPTCGVCKTRYQNVTISSRKQCRPRIAAMITLCFLNTAITLGAGIYLFGWSTEPEWMPILAGAMLAMSLGFGMSFVWLVAAYQLVKRRIVITVSKNIISEV